MKITITLRKMHAYKQQFLDADFNYFQAELKFTVLEAIAKVERNRGVQAMLLNAVRKASPGMNLTIDAMLTSLDILASVDIVKYKILHKDNEYSTVMLEMNDVFFDVFEMLRRTTHIPVGWTKKDFIKHLDKEMRKTYTKDLTITDEDEDG